MPLFSSKLNFVAKAQSKNPAAVRHSFVFTDIPRYIRAVVETLTEAGFDAYLVGGCVRDALLHITPKDFDVATNAEPHQVKKLFGKRAALIGRRFLIVHVRTKGHIVEVTTFRGQPRTLENETLVSDNHFGTISQDALRRDLSINALYYCLATEEIIDFVQGYEDVHTRKIRVIGDAVVRFQEDPVRMLRCVRFAAKLDMRLPAPLRRLIGQHAPLLEQVSKSRLLGEFLKLNTHPSVERAIALCKKLGLLAELFPSTSAILTSRGALAKQSHLLIEEALRNTDMRLRNNGRVSSFYLFAVFLWPLVRAAFQSKDRINQANLIKAANQALNDITRMQIPKSFSTRIISVWLMQMRLQYPKDHQCMWLLAHKDFRAAYDFLQLREKSGEMSGTQASDWWKTLQNLSPKEQTQHIEQLQQYTQGKDTKLRTLSGSIFE